MEALYASAALGLGLIGFAAGRIVAFNKIADLTEQLSTARREISVLNAALSIKLECIEVLRKRLASRKSAPANREAIRATARELGWKPEVKEAV